MKIYLKNLEKRGNGMVIVESKGKRKLISAFIYFMENEIPNTDADIINYMAVASVPDKLKKSISIESQRTLVSDLKETENVLFSKIQPRMRSAIRKADKENIKYRYFNYDKIDDDVIQKISNVYCKMYKSKGMDVDSPEMSIRDRIDAKAILITEAYVSDISLVYHAYVYDEKHTRLLYSCSDFRNEQDIEILIGLANKSLHWHDMKMFKEQGVEMYDWGGVNSFDEPNGIDVFKMKFGADRKIFYNIIQNKTLLAKLLNGKLYQLVKKIR